MRDISHHPDIFNQEQLNGIWNYLREPKWEFWHTSNPDSSNFFWYMDFSDNEFFTKDLFTKIKKSIGNNFSIERVYANGQTFGLDGEFHIDDEDENAYTFLYYPVKDWNLSWGGETVIIDSNSNVNNIYPMPNCGILFPSNWLHCGKSPSKNFTDLRITIAYKLKNKN